MDFAPYLEDLIQRFLRNADGRGTAVPARRASKLEALDPALETARDVITTLRTGTRKVAWRTVVGSAGLYEDFPPLPKPVARYAERRPTNDIVGFIHDIRIGISVSRLLIPGTLDYAALVADLKGDHFTQLTVIDADLVAYTLRVPMREVPAPRGAMVRVRILQKGTGGTPWYLCRGLWLLEMKERTEHRWAVSPAFR